MSDRVLDFRSDTVTKPTEGMRRAMAAAEVGDDVFGDDPTVNRLQERIADMLGKEAALFVPSGTMSNLIAVRSLCMPGDEMICEANAHIFHNEQGGYAQLCGVAARPVHTSDGIMTVEHVAGLIRPANVHQVRTRLLTIENTHNAAGGIVQPYDTVVQLCQWAKENGLVTHLDGARLFNAVVATGISADRWAQHFDTVNVCFSKGLGAPVGSALVGTQETIQVARRHRKVLGGGMRQAGVLAAAALYALDHHIERLAEDHANARLLAERIRQIDGLQLDPDRVETNMVFFKVDPALADAAELCRQFASRGLLVCAVGKHRIRMVTHLHITQEQVDEAAEIIADTLQRLKR